MVMPKVLSTLEMKEEIVIARKVKNGIMRLILQATTSLSKYSKRPELRVTLLKYS